MGSKFDGVIMTDTALPFGWCESVRIFTILDDFVNFVMHDRLPEPLKRRLHGKRWLLFYIDDFIVGAPSRDLCAALMQHTIATFQFLGLEIKWSKLQRPAQQLKILGFVYVGTSFLINL